MFSNQLLYTAQYQPSDKALEFYTATLEARQLLWMGGKRSLKTTSVCYMTACHLLGIYPKWWPGYRYDRPIRAMVGTVKATKTRDVLQKYFLDGEPEFGLYPFLHPDKILDKVPATGIPRGLDKLKVRHASGGISELKFMSFAEGAGNLQSERYDLVHLDESASLEVYLECLHRTAAMGDYATFVFLTMWPEHGRDNVVDFFMNKGSAGEIIKGHFYMHSSWANNPFMRDEEKQRLRDATPLHMLEAVEHGIPIFGVGKVFTMDESTVLCNPFEVPDHYRLIAGIDPSATSKGYWGAVLLALDPDTECVYVIKNYKETGLTIGEHYDNLRQMIPKWVNCVMDPSGGGEDQATKLSALEFLRERGMNIVKADKTKNKKEAIIGQIEGLCRSNKFHIFNNCHHYLDEWRRYARDEGGRILKENDHTLDASFYALDQRAEHAQKESEVRNYQEELRQYYARQSFYGGTPEPGSWMNF